MGRLSIVHPALSMLVGKLSIVHPTLSMLVGSLSIVHGRLIMLVGRLSIVQGNLTGLVGEPTELVGPVMTVNEEQVSTRRRKVDKIAYWNLISSTLLFLRLIIARSKVRILPGSPSKQVGM